MNNNLALETHMDAKWAIKKVVANGSISALEKHKRVREILMSAPVSGKPVNGSLGFKGEVYRFLINRRLALAIMLLEIALAKNAKDALVPSKLINCIDFRIGKPSRPISRSERTAFIFMVPDLGNLGDLAIGFAQKKFLEDNLTGFSIVEIPHSDTYRSARAVKSLIRPDDIIFLTGGGNLGTLYKEAEEQRRFLITLFKSNRIIQFPQSTFFEDSTYGHGFLKESMDIYSSHSALTIIARDRESYSLISSCFSNEVLLFPDTVLYMAPLRGTGHRDQRLTLSIRRDLESKVSSEGIKSIQRVAESFGLSIEIKDTNIDNLGHTLEDREDALNSIWSIYLASRLVITDRLHGVIFCAITGTPCVAIDNSNGKVLNLIGTWLQDADFIIPVKDPSEADLMQAGSHLLGCFPNGSDPVDLTKEFDLMISSIAPTEAQ